MNEVKITFVGDSGTGKTNILRVFEGYKFSEICEVKKSDTFTKYMVVNNCSYILELRDTLSSENFHPERLNLYRDTDIFFICFAEDNPISFKNVLVRWFTEIKKIRPKAPIVLVCTKFDIRSKAILNQEIFDMKKKIKAIQIVFCSAKSGLQIKEMFEQAILNTYDAVSKPSTLISKFLMRSNSAH